MSVPPASPSPIEAVAPGGARRRRRWPWVLLGVLVAVAALIGACEWAGWPFVKGPAQRWLSERLQREVAFGEQFQLRLFGRIRLGTDAFTVGPPTGDAAPDGVPDRFVDASEVRLVVPYSTVFAALRADPDRPIAPRINELEVARLDAQLRRDESGQSNWQFGAASPSASETPTALPQFDRLVVRDGRIGLDDAVSKLKLDVELRTEEGDATPQGAGLRVAGKGSYQGRALSFRATSSGALPIVASDAHSPPLPVTLAGRMGEVRLEFDGQAADLVQLRSLDGRYSLSGPSLAAVGDAIGVTLPSTASFTMRGTLRKAEQVWSTDVAALSVGASRLAGAFSYDPRPRVPLLSGELRGERLVLADLAPTIGAPPQPAGASPQRTAASSQQAGASSQQPRRGDDASRRSDDTASRAGDGAGRSDEAARRAEEAGRRTAEAALRSGDMAYQADGTEPAPASAQTAPATAQTAPATAQTTPAPARTTPGSPAQVRAAQARATPQAAAQAANRGSRILPQREFDIPSLKAMDATVKIALRELDLSTDALEPFRPLEGSLTLQEGELKIESLNAGAAGGRVSGALALDSRPAAPVFRADLKWAGVDLDRWLTPRNPNLKAESEEESGQASGQASGASKGPSAEAREKAPQRPPQKAPRTAPNASKGKQGAAAKAGASRGAAGYLSGSLGGELKLTGTGRSTAAILASLDGSAAAWIRNGAVSHLAVEALGLDLAQGLGLLIVGDEPLPLNCAAARFVAKRGELQNEVGVFDTRDSTIFTSGSLSLADERLALVLTARPKDFSPLTLRAPLRVEGSFANPDVRLDGKTIGLKVLAAAALAAVNPLAALIPLMDLGDAEQRNCREALAERQFRGTRR
ncbi:MAG: hypothetical protein AB7F71_17140 [Burkholderiaceae bacterium]